MTESNKFQCVDTISLYDDGIGYVKLYDASHSNESEEQLSDTAFSNYAVTIDGKVISIRNGIELKTHSYKSGYVYVIASYKGNKYKKLLHRVVAEKYIPNPDGKPCVNHIDGNKSNNHAANLEWVTYSENEQHSFHVLGKKDTFFKAVEAFDTEGNLVHSFESMREAHRSGFNSGRISDCCKGKIKTHKGLSWKLKD